MIDDVPMRERVLSTIRSYPGIHLRGLMKQLDTSTALARYHVKALQKESLVRCSTVGGFVRYFPQGMGKKLNEADRLVLGTLRQDRPLEIALALLEHGHLQHRDLHELLGGSKATLTYQLEKMMDVDIVRKVAKGEERGFHLVDPDRVRALLASYEPVPELLEQVHDLWDDLFHGHRSPRRSGKRNR